MSIPMPAQVSSQTSAVLSDLIHFLNANSSMPFIEASMSFKCDERSGRRERELASVRKGLVARPGEAAAVDTR